MVSVRAQDAVGETCYHDTYRMFVVKCSPKLGENPRFLLGEGHINSASGGHVESRGIVPVKQTLQCKIKCRLHRCSIIDTCMSRQCNDKQHVINKTKIARV
jgi:hypothetical protein